MGKTKGTGPLIVQVQVLNTQLNGDITMVYFLKSNDKAKQIFGKLIVMYIMDL